MKFPLIGLCVAGSAMFLLQTGIPGPVSSALAAEQCVKTEVVDFKNRCPPDVTLTGNTAASTGGAPVEDADIPTEPVEPIATVTPTAASAEPCIKTEVAYHVRRCPDGT
jgi:hypothetical protein